MARRALILLALGAASACSRKGDDGAGSPTSGNGPRIVRPLATASDVVIRSRWQPASSAPREAGLPTRFARSFEQEEESFPFTPVRVLAAGEPAPAPPKRTQEATVTGRAGLSFPAASGAVLWWLPAVPESAYVVSCSARRAAAPSPRAGETPDAAEARAMVGRLVVVELERAAQPLPRELPPLPKLEPSFGTRLAEHRAAPPTEAGKFVQERLEFATSSRTASLLVILFAGVPGWWQPSEGVTAGATGTAAPEGTVDFDDLALVELPLARRIQTRADEGAAPPGISAWRRAFSLEGELRPALIAVPPTEIRIALSLPRGSYRLRFAYGLANEGRASWARESIRFFARLETPKQSLEIPLTRPLLHPREEIADNGWQECRYDGVGDGEAATLTLATSVESGRPCDDVALFSEPELVAAPATPASGARPNVLLVSLDTLRADRIGRQHAATRGSLTPRLDELATRSVVFTAARSLAPYTLPSHATLLTGLPPAIHGVEQYTSCARPSVHPFLAQRFADAGYATMGFTAGGFLGPPHGLWHGFDRWFALDPFAPADDPLRSMLPQRGATALNQEMWRRASAESTKRWLAEHRDEPFFLFVHTYLVHNYRPPADLAAAFHASATGFDPLMQSDERTPTDAELPGLIARYDATVAAADREVGGLIDALRELGLLERTIVVVCSDHGEEFGEHGGFGHGRTLYEEVLHVPLMVRAPGIAPHPVSDEVTLADVAPTLLSLCGLEPLPGAGGRALLPEPAGEEPVIAAEVDEAHLGSQRALWLGGRKLIVVDRMSPIRPPLPTHACFDLASDPGEKTNLVRLDADGAALPDAEQPPFLLLLAARLTDVFAGYSQQRAQLQVDVNAPSVSDPDLEKLGYGVGNEKRRDH